ncbi:MAG TPA: hypothetical protein VL401_02625 [Alphaproteobacteria bacterium]|jgi:hypothetical protein|nr:hypothetical protein [Alphaproteobacteria bacterium]
MKNKILKILFVILMITSVVIASLLSWNYYAPSYYYGENIFLALFLVLFMVPLNLIMNARNYSDLCGLVAVFAYLSPHFVLFALFSLFRYLKTGKLNKYILIILLACGVFYLILLYSNLTGFTGGFCLDE